ncbi:MAG: lactate utilization protein C [Acidiferrobacteraceae bacterium]|jgi:L-lactate dehydrogenase complex protein LldG|nr:lactate utilization protein C [Acidiferrobacteraceae bacterium]MDP6917708.1 LUD domain-containing protein [Arenicellales bacterium]|tara:strand:+ start:44213 stop:44893 length:681 start_codon:yes stop_codon:yes gene_type:complete
MACPQGQAMTQAREEILGTIRKSLAAGDPRTPRRLEELKSRIQDSAPQVQPYFDDDLLTRFCQKHVAVHGTYERIRKDGIEAAVVRHLTGLGLDTQWHTGVGPLLDATRWSDQVFVYRKCADKDTKVALTEAFAAVAETGTLVMCSGPAAPTSQNYLPDNHVIIVDSRRIVRHMEDLWAMLRTTGTAAARAVNLITGPSKTGDIEQTIQYGAHGPRRLHVLIVEEA